MAGEISLPKKYAIRNYLYRHVRELSSESVRLMTEEALADKFQVNRMTVRSAIHDLEKTGIVRRLPGKKGIYSNPLHGSSGIRVIGVVNSSPAEPYLHPFQHQLLALVLMKMFKVVPFRLQFPILSGNPETAMEQLFDYSFDAVLWMHFTSAENRWLSALETLLQRDYPLIVVNNAMDDSLPGPLSSNMITFNYRALAVRKAAFVNQAASGRALYLGDDAAVDRLFQEALRSECPNLEKVDFFLASRRMPEDVLDMLKRTGAETLICGGDVLQNRQIFRMLLAHPELSHIRVIQFSNVDGIPVHREFPQLNIIPAPELITDPKAVLPPVARHLKAILMKKERHFQNIYIS